MAMNNWLLLSILLAVFGFVSDALAEGAGLLGGSIGKRGHLAGVSTLPEPQQKQDQPQKQDQTQQKQDEAGVANNNQQEKSINQRNH